LVNGGVKACQWGGAKEGQFVLHALERVALKYKSTVYIPKASRITKGQKWLTDKRLVPQNIDGLDGKAGNAGYVPIHGRLDKVTVLHEQGLDVPLIDAPWEDVSSACADLDDNARLTPVLLDAFKISKDYAHTRA
jgi:hypothetical protein